MLAGSLSVLLSCSGGGDRAAVDSGEEDAQVGQVGDAADSGAGEGIVHTYAPTYDAVWNEILVPNCALVFCHAGSADYLQLPSESAGYASLVEVRAEGPLCVDSGLKRVVPYEPDASLMYLKITAPPCGSKMPLSYGYPVTLDPREIEQVRTWIACGAFDGDAGCIEAGSAPDATENDAMTDASSE